MRSALLLLALLTLIVPSAAQEIIVDDADPGFSKVSGSWPRSANAGYYGTGSLYAFTGGSEQKVRWSATLPKAGEYQVSAWWVPSSNRASDAPYTVSTSTGPNVVFADQTANGGKWNVLGNFVLSEGASTVELSNQAAGGDYVSADAVRWVFVKDANPGESCVDPQTSLVALGAAGNCAGLRMPGAPDTHPSAKWMIHSDLPELFSSNGVLYSTRAILPNDSGNTVPLNLRTQTNAGFTTIDDDFELFLFHITTPGDGSAPRRIVIYVQNNDVAAVTIQPRQVIMTQGTIGNIHQMESDLGRRWMEGSYDTRPAEVTIPAGGAAAVAYSNNFGGFGPGIDANINCFGLVHADVVNRTASTDLTVSVVAIPAGQVSGINAATDQWMNVAATSAEGSIDITTAPGAGELRRAVGVFPNFEWRSDAVTIDAAALTTAGKAFQMALSEIQAGGCPTGRQTVDMVLHPGFAHGDTIGNYQVDYRVMLHLVNSSQDSNKAFDIQFGRGGADIGLAWRVLSSSMPPSDALVDIEPVYTSWAGPSQSDGVLFDSMLQPAGGRITLRPCSEVYVAIRFAVLGNSSLPFQLKVVSAVPDDLPPTAAPNGWIIR